MANAAPTAKITICHLPPGNPENIQTIFNYPKRIISILLIMTFIFAFGIKWFHIDDDMMKMLPEDIESRVSWEEIQNESELYVVFAISDDSDEWEPVQVIAEDPTSTSAPPPT